MPVAQEFLAGKVEVPRIVVLHLNVVGPFAQRFPDDVQVEATRLELAVFEDGEVDAADIQAGVVDADSLLDRRLVVRVGQVRGLLPLHHLHVLGGASVAALAVAVHLPAAAAPDVGLAHIVVVRDGHRRPLPHELAEVLTELQPELRVLCVWVDLIPGEEQHIRIELHDAVDDVVLRYLPPAGPWRVPREGRGDDHPLAGGAAADQTLVSGAKRMTKPVPHIAPGVPALDAERRGEADGVHLRLGNRLPVAPAPHLQRNSVRLVVLQRVELGRELQHALMDGVQREADDLVPRHLGNLGPVVHLHERWPGSRGIRGLRQKRTGQRHCQDGGNSHIALPCGPCPHTLNGYVP